MTIVEMLVAMGLSLLVILAVTQAFRVVGDGVLASRAVAEMSNQLRSTSDLLRNDLQRATVPALPNAEFASGPGYLEIYEGPFWDMGIGAPAAGTPAVPRDRPMFAETSVGDFDDMLMLTARSVDEPFLGQALDFTVAPPVPTTLNSKIAEVLWFTRFDDKDADSQPDPGEVSLHRRAMLVLPQLNVVDPLDGLPMLNIPGLSSVYPDTSGATTLSPEAFFHAFDLSVGYRPRVDASGNIVAWVRFANSLENLSLRENRTGHRLAFPTGVPAPAVNTPFPFFASRYFLRPQGTVMTQGPDSAWGVTGVRDFDDGSGGPVDQLMEAGAFGSDDLTAIDTGALGLGQMFGNDVVQSQLLAFDVKVFDPTVPVLTLATSNDPLLPGDPGYLQRAGEAARLPAGQGGYVDLFYSRYTTGVTSRFSLAPLARSGMQRFQEIIWAQAPTFPAVYDLYSTFYERDGIDQDGNGIIDQGTNGFDDDGNGSVDDIAERETSPPYPFPMRGLEIRIRIIDNDSRQVRQVTVTGNFLPE